jgi:hypothetical protein
MKVKHCPNCLINFNQHAIICSNCKGELIDHNIDYIKPVIINYSKSEIKPKEEFCEWLFQIQGNKYKTTCKARYAFKIDIGAKFCQFCGKKVKEL